MKVFILKIVLKFQQTSRDPCVHSIFISKYPFKTKLSLVVVLLLSREPHFSHIQYILLQQIIYKY